MVNKTLLELKEYIPLIALLFYTLGFMYSILYFNYFSININNYNNINDLFFIGSDLLLFIIKKYLVIEITRIILVYYFVKLLINILFIPNKKLESRSNNIVERYNIRIKKSIIQKLKTYTTYSFLTLFPVFVLDCQEEIDDFAIFYSTYLVYATPISKTNKKNTEQKAELYLRIIIFIGLLFFYFAQQAKNKAVNSLQFGKTQKVTLFYDNDSQVTSTDSSKLIGENSNFIFLYDLVNKTSIIYPKSELKKIQFQHISKTNPSKGLFNFDFN